MHAGIEAVDAARLVVSAFDADGAIGAGSPHLVDVIAAGKAAGPMAQAAALRLGARLRRGVVTAARPTQGAPAGLRWIASAHPLPDASSVAAGRAALEVGRDRDGRAVLLVLLSGGASAMMALPAPGVPLADKMDTIAQLLRAGTPIDRLNAVRKHLSAIKGGQLALGAGPVVTYALSDVVAPIENDPGVIGSGPTVPDETTFAEAIDVLGAAGVYSGCAASVRARLEAGQRGELDETPHPGDSRLTASTLRIVGSRHDAMRGAVEEAVRRGYLAVTVLEPITGEARVAAAAYASRLSALAATTARPLCLVSSGETTVDVVGTGRGGRNQEFAAALADRLDAMPRAVVVASAGTDGVDGPTDAAGALVGADTIARARAEGLDAPSAYLARNDTYAFFDGLGDLIRTGPTGTNVGDIQVAVLT